MLTKTHILSFKDEHVYKNPTEIIPMTSCCTVKSVEEEINKQFSFVSNNYIVFGFVVNAQMFYRNLKSKEERIICKLNHMLKRKAGSAL